MSELKTRISLLYRTYAQWSAYTTEFIPLMGEVCYCEIPQGATVEGIDTSVARILLKVGDGTTSFPALKWVSALPATATGNSIIYKIGLDNDGNYILQQSSDKGVSWSAVEGSATVSFTEIKNRISAIEALNISDRLTALENRGGLTKEEIDEATEIV